MKASQRRGMILSALPSVIMLLLFYSLAFHMHQTLGAWPSSIGERGFPHALAAHATITVDFCIALAVFTAFVLPACILVCLFVARWRRFVPYLALFGMLSIVCWGLMQLAPE